MNAAARLVEVRVPDMGNFKDVAIIDVLVKPGESIELEAPLVTLETEKATMDVPSTVGGVIEKIHVKKGGTVSTGDLIVTVRSEAVGADPSQGPQPSATAPAQAPAAAGRASSAGSTPPVVNTPPQGQAGSAGASAAPVTAAPSSASAAATSVSTVAGSASGTASAAAVRAGVGSAAPSGAGATSPAGAGTAVATGAAAGVPAGVNAAAAAARLPVGEPGFSSAHAGPSVRKFARELGVDLSQVTGTGFKARITHDDVKAFVKRRLSGSATGATVAGAVSAAAGSSGLPAIPAVDFSKFGPVELQPLSRIQRISGPRLHASWVNIPHVTQFDEADITDLEDVRTKLKQKALLEGIKLTPLAFIFRACVKALEEFPLFNSSLDASGANLVLKKYVHIGFAADTPNGLVVPVIHDANRKDVYELARQLGELSEKARSGKLTAAQMQGGCFTISSLGGIGGTAFTPIINAPEVAILGVSRSTLRPVYKDGAFVPRLLLPLSLSYDHRVIDGALAVRFTTFLAQTLSDPRGLTDAVP